MSLYSFADFPLLSISAYNEPPATPNAGALAVYPSITSTCCHMPLLYFLSIVRPCPDE